MFESITNFFGTIFSVIEKFTAWLWGPPLLILLVGGGIILAVFIHGVQFRHLGFVFKTTVGTIFDKEEQAKKKAAGISPLQGMLAAVGATVGTGNIVGVGAAIATGGPGALFWMWVCGFIAMGIKYSEVTLSCHYREKATDGEGYKGGPYMYIRNGLHNKVWANAFGIMMLVTMSVICAVHGNAISSNLSTLGVSKYVSCVALAVFVIAVALGGMKLLVKITDKLVPFMGIFYCLFALIVIFANIKNVGTVFASIFKGAFTGTAALGGFAGATISAAIRQGLARGVFSSDAGLGLSASVQAQVGDIDHPAHQGTWAIIETFIDTIIICTLTGLVILFTGVWTQGIDGSLLTATGMSTVLGVVGQYGCVIALVLFGASSLITDAEGVSIQSRSMWDSKVIGRVFQVVLLGMVIYGSLAKLDSVFTILDFANGLVLILNVPALILLGKTLSRLTGEWFGNNGDLEAIRAEREKSQKQ